MLSHSDKANLSFGPEGFVCELAECNSIFKARCMLIKHERLEHRTQTEQKIVDSSALEKCDDLVQGIIKENRHQSLPKVQFTFKSTRPPRIPHKNIVGISDDCQQNISSDIHHEVTSLSDPNGKKTRRGRPR